MIKLKELRLTKGIKSQKEMAKILGVSYSTYNYWENGRFEPDSDMIKKIADYFNVSTDYILGRYVPSSSQKSDNTVSIIARGGESVEAELSDEQAEMMINFIKSLKEQNKGRNIDKKRE